uniref:Uncharacterized protein n=1 Tax=Spermophilus dauricus TaxID=99837 RepID=A0A8C9Q7H5_SPEDA
MLWKVLLFVGLVVLGAHLCSNRFVDIDKTKEYFALSLEYAIFWFNEALEDKFAYKFLRVRRSHHCRWKMSFLYDIGTKCYKFEDNIDNCPFQDTLGQKRVKWNASLPCGLCLCMKWGVGATHNVTFRDLEE